MKVFSDLKVFSVQNMNSLKRQNKNTVILMTACVDPKGMGFTILQDPRIRKSQYLEAIEFYLNETKYNIVFCENTGANLFDEIKSPEKHSRLEYLTFQGNDYKKSIGKSLGEAQIIKYAIQHSKFIKEKDYIIKITGRIKVLNINEILSDNRRNTTAPNVVMTRFPVHRLINTVCFIAPKEWMLHTVDKYASRINEEESYTLEKVFYDSIVASPEIKIKPCYPIISGICASDNKSYPNYSLPQRKLDHSAVLYNVYKIRGEKWNCLKTLFNWCCYVIYRKWYVISNN